MPYSIPSWDAVNFSFSEIYSLPNALSVQLDLSSLSDNGPQYIGAYGVDAGSFGSHSASWRKYVVPTAWESLLIGDHAFYASFYVEFGFNSTYSPPAWDAVSVDFAGAGSLFAIGINDGAFGSVDIANKSRTLFPSGIAAANFGSPAATLGASIITPSGINAASWGAARIVGPQHIIPSGVSAFKGFGFGADGSGFIDFAIRTLRPAGLVATSFGSAVMAGGVRTVDIAGHGAAAGAFGTLQIAYRERFLYPSWFGGGVLGIPAVDRTHFVTASGWESLAFGISYAHDNKQYLAPTSFFGASFGTPELGRSPRIVAPVGFVAARDILPNERWGLPTAYNSDQHVTQIHEVTPSDGGVFGSPIWMSIENRNRTVRAFGHQDSKFGAPTIVNKAVPLLPTGLDATRWGSALIAYRIRTVTPEGVEPSGFSNYNVVIKTPELFPVGVVRGAFGTPGVVNTRRYYYNIAVGDTGAFGTSFIAPRVRSIEPYYSYEGVVGSPEVFHNPRYLLPTSIKGGFGYPYVIEHFNIVSPRWVYRGAVGEPWIYNSTPNLFPYGREQTEWGATAIRTAWRRLTLEGFEAIVFPKQVIERRTKTVRPAGMLAMRIGVGFDVRNVIPDPPVTHTIQPTGIATPTWYSQPIVFGNVLYAKGFSAFLWGDHTVRLQGAIVSGILEWAFGSARVSGPQYVDLYEKGIQAPDEEDPGAKWAHVDPYTIWCWEDPPEQALRNNGGSGYEQMDAWLHGSDHPERPVFGAATVTNRNRGVSTTGSAFAGLGEPEVTLKQRRIYAQGLTSFRYGIAKLNAPQEINLATKGLSYGSYGTPTIAYREGPDIPRYLRPQGLAGEWGAARVEFFNRTVAPTGIDATTFGTGRIHPPEPLIPTGLNATVWGDPMIAYRIRRVYPTGWDGFMSEEEPGYFIDRMRVYKNNLLRMRPAGIDAASWGTAFVDQSTRVISGAGAIGQWTISHGAELRRRNSIVLAGYGWDSSLFGDVRRWEAGKIKPQGETHDLWGLPRIDRRTTVAGWGSLGMGAPRMADAIDPDAIDASAWGLPTITHGDNLDFVCGQSARAIPPPGWDAITFGIPTIS